MAGKTGTRMPSKKMAVVVVIGTKGPKSIGRKPSAKKY
jgi:hypothetical protein